MRPDLDTVVAPGAVAGSLVVVGLQLRGQLGQVQEDVAGAAQHWGGVGQLAPGADQLSGVQQVTAAITLVPPGILQHSTQHQLAMVELVMLQTACRLSCVQT